MTKKSDVLAEERRKHRFKLFDIDTRATFILSQPVIENTSKALLNVATFVFAGSLTFLGLKDGIHQTVYLKWSWVLLGASVFAHLVLYLALLVALMAHGRVETDNFRAEETLKAGGVKELLKGALSSFANDEIFRRGAHWVIAVLIMQNILVISGSVLIGFFVFANLST